MTAALEVAKAWAKFDNLARLYIRSGRVVEAPPFPRARNPSYRIAVDLGPLQRLGAIGSRYPDIADQHGQFGSPARKDA